MAEQNRQPPKLDSAEVDALMRELDGGWSVVDDGTRLVRKLAFKGFAKAVLTANLAAWVGDQQRHHPDVTFGWGYCEVVFTTHDVAGLTRLDFDAARKFDAMVADGN